MKLADHHPYLALPFVGVLLLVAVSGCENKSAPSAAASSAASSAVAPPPTSAAPTASAAPQTAAVSSFTPLSDIATCNVKSGEVATYIQRTGLGLAGRADGSFAAVWLVELPNRPDAQIGFGGFDGQAKPAARVRPVGNTQKPGLRIFSAGDTWTVTWFDGEGMSYSQPRWETSPPPSVDRLKAVGQEGSENIAIAPTPSGSLVAVAPFGAARDQLGVFLFAHSNAENKTPKALGATHDAKQPRRPAVAATATGYIVAWYEADDSIKASRFDLNGKEGTMHTISPPGAKHEGLALATAGSGALATWTDGDLIQLQALDEEAKPNGSPKLLGAGKWMTLASQGNGALALWVGHDGKSDEQMVLAKLSSDGTASSQGVRVSDGTSSVKDAPALAVAKDRVGVMFMDGMGAGVSSKRVTLRVFDAACIP